MLSTEEFDGLSHQHIVLDLRRPLQQIKKGTIEGGYLFPAQGNIALFAGSLFKPHSTFLGLCDIGEEQQIANRLLRVGFRIVGFAGFKIEQWIHEGRLFWVPSALSIEQVRDIPDKIVLDSRAKREWIEKGIVKGANCVYFPDIERRVQEHPEEFPKDKHIYVYCRLALRARIGASILHKLGYQNISIIPETFE